MTPGTTLGPYKILAPIGAGGMGEVYRGRDTKLDREVAIKVLPAALAQDAERLARFEREAKVLAALNHPNIAQVYGLEESDGIRALVMELVPGETLAQSIKASLSLETALNYARQIADALEAAHEKAITHRDLKPANIMITPDGVVKVLDFGLAAFPGRERDASGNPSDSPTLTISPTRAGMILGTAAYMSPEQAAGKPVDKRADIWSFGVVLWEMLTGEQLFRGESVSHILASVLKDEPDLTRVPLKVRRLLRRCLEKDPKKRLRDIGDAMELVNETAIAAASSGQQRGYAGWIAAGLLAVLTIAVGLIHFREAPASTPPMKLNVDLGPGVSLSARPGFESDFALSPDGTKLVYASGDHLYLQRLDQDETVELPGTEGAGTPFFSPDGRWVGFFTNSELKKVAIEGGGAITLGPNLIGTAGSWGDDGNIVFSSLDGSLSVIRDTGGQPGSVGDRKSGDIFPHVLPGGKTFLFTTMNGPIQIAGGQFTGGTDLEVMSLADHTRKKVIQGATFARYVASGHIVYLNGDTLFAVPFDLDRLEVRGSAVPILEDVAKFDISRSGTLVYVRPQGGAMRVAQWADGSGKLLPLLSKPGLYGRPKLSPDARQLAVEVASGPREDSDIWIYDTRRDTMTRLTFDGGNRGPVWSPDGRFVVFNASRKGVYWVRADGSSKPQALTHRDAGGDHWPGSFTPDGKRLAFHTNDSGTGFNLWTVPVEVDGVGLRAGKPEVFLQTPADERSPAFSPDGHWLAYYSNESGTNQVYVRPFPDTGGKWQISNDGGAYPEWSHTSRELFYRTPDSRKIMVATYITRGDTFLADKPREWADVRLVQDGRLGLNRNYDLAVDGKRIVALVPAVAGQNATNHVVFLLNFFDELKRLVPVE